MASKTIMWSSCYGLLTTLVFGRTHAHSPFAQRAGLDHIREGKNSVPANSSRDIGVQIIARKSQSKEIL